MLNLNLLDKSTLVYLHALAKKATGGIRTPRGLSKGDMPISITVEGHSAFEILVFQGCGAQIDDDAAFIAACDPDMICTLIEAILQPNQSLETGRKAVVGLVQWLDRVGDMLGILHHESLDECIVRLNQALTRGQALEKEIREYRFLDREIQRGVNVQEAHQKVCSKIDVLLDNK